ncbi:hypothetical protein [Pedobacter sp. R20-19]|uniref:hypothetical protein n=1 Tax=Pedobacter sp. R20-19 TaxID=1270196 RepID=UPI0004932245|nr:hypothetical protein [Pedobacter sp. R20-19]
MNIDNIWEKLNPNEQSLETLRRDLSEGKVPNLPYFVVNQQIVKKVIAKNISDIDGDRMQTNLIIAQYGNGKTNLLKYLQLFFESNKFGIDVVYSRADREQPDLVIFLLKLIQDKYSLNLISYIKSLRNRQGIAEELADNFKANFSGIKEFTIQLFNPSRTDEQIQKLIFLGTGRLYTKGHFKEFDLPQLMDFDRREVLVVFLNILAKSNHYIIFGIDEIEKIQEKSKLRLNHFLTSYRELIDLFNKIKGHYILTCFTDATGAFEIQSANEALYTRIRTSLLTLPPISNRDDFSELMRYLNELFDTNRNESDLDNIIGQLMKANHQRNRDILQHSIELLRDQVVRLSISEMLIEEGLEKLFINIKTKLQLDGAFKSLNQKFFDPLKYYLEDNYLITDDGDLSRRYQYFIDHKGKKTHYFLFNDFVDKSEMNMRLNNIPAPIDYNFVIYAPEKLELSNSDVEINNAAEYKILDYSPDDMFVLLNMYRDNFEYTAAIAKIIVNYTEKNL